MKFKCSRERLLGGLQTVGSVVSTRGMKPVYESVLILSREGQLQLQGTDLEVAIRFNLKDDTLVVEEHGSLVVPAARLTAILKEVDDEDIDFTWKEQALSVECRGSLFKINGYPPEEFPEIPDFPSEATMQLPAEVFRRLVAGSAFAAAREKMRYALNGVLFFLSGDRLQMVGTDGRRLAHAVATVENPEGAEIKAIVPTKGINQMARIISGDEVIDLSLKDNQLAARTGCAVVVSRLVEGTFPNFEEVIPVNCERKAVFNREDLVSAVRKARLLTNKESQSVRFAFDEGRLTLTARAAEVGEANVSLDMSYEGEPAAVAFNPGYVLEGLSVMTGETVSFEFRSPTSPAKFTDGGDFTYVVMPIDIQ